MLIEIATQPIFFIIIIVALMILILFRFEVAMAIGLLAMIWLFIIGSDLVILPRRFFSGIDSFVMLAIPLFILTGEILNRARMTERIMDFANTLVGRARGGLAHANVIGSMVFGGIQGAAVADVATLGTVFIPPMKKQGYPLAFSAAITASSSLVAPLIPPSIMIIIFGALCGISIGGLLLAAIIPGFLIGITDSIIVHLEAERRKFPRGKVGRTLKDILISGKDAALALMCLLIILFGIVWGVFTPTEAAAVAVVYALFVAVVIYRKFGLGDFYHCIKASVRKASMILIIIGFAMVLAWMFARLNLGKMIAGAIFGITSSPAVVLVLMCLILLFVGTWLEGTATIYMLGPLFWSIASEFGIHPLHFGIVFLLMINIAMITPPLGVCLFTAQAVSGAPFPDIVKEVMPFLVLDLGVIAICVFFPQILLFLPGLFGLA